MLASIFSNVQDVSLESFYLSKIALSYCFVHYYFLAVNDSGTPNLDYPRDFPSFSTCVPIVI